MADELNIPTHRWYEPRNHIALAKEDVSRQYIYDSGIQKIDAWIASQPWGDLDSYIVNGFSPSLVLDFIEDYYRTGGSASTFDDALNFSRAGNATMVDSDGLLKWAPHNTCLQSETFSSSTWKFLTTGTIEPDAIVAPDGTQTADRLVASAASASAGAVGQSSPGLVLGSSFRFWAKAGTVNFVGCDAANTPGPWAWFDLSSGTVPYSAGCTASMQPAGDGWYLCKLDNITVSPPNRVFILAKPSAVNSGPWSSVNPAIGDSIYLWGAHLYRSDLGGMVSNPDQPAGFETYVPTTSAARYLPRRSHHIWNGSAWVDEGYFHESEARTNLLLNSGTLSTQSVTVTAVPHTLHFTGTGTVTLSGASTAGPLVGTGTGEQNRVSLTFTPTAGTLIVTVTGTVTNADLEVGSTPSSYIPTAGATVTRAADAMTIPAANLPWNPLAVSIQMEGTMTYADENATGQYQFIRWYFDQNNRIDTFLSTSVGTGFVGFQQRSGGVLDGVNSSTTAYSPGVNVPFNIASRHGSTFINGAVDGVALTANTTPTALPYLENTDLNLAFDYMGTIKKFRFWSDDLGDAGIEEAST